MAQLEIVEFHGQHKLRVIKNGVKHDVCCFDDFCRLFPNATNKEALMNTFFADVIDALNDGIMHY